jgi:DNA-binding transcriptional regulator YhcF (GntR family)
MKIWLTKNSEVSVHEQLVTQISIGIASGDLEIGEKVPSTKEISRRFQIHANTVSAAYQELADLGWLAFKKGSGFFVKDAKPTQISNQLDQIIAQFFQTAQKGGFTLAEIQNRLPRYFEIQRPDHFLVIESDKGLQDILVSEIADATGFRVFATTLEDFERKPNVIGAMYVAMLESSTKVNEILPSNKNCTVLRATSVAESMVGQTRPTVGELIAVISGWEKFLWLAKTMLIAAEIDAESLIVRSTSQPKWTKGLEKVSMVITDSLAAKQLPSNNKTRIFRVISEVSLAELRELID